MAQFEVVDPILPKYRALNGENGPLGLPTSDSGRNSLEGNRNSRMAS
jgi:hypothetical protein